VNTAFAQYRYLSVETLIRESAHETLEEWNDYLER
jgi:hypothetical protein